ncbi:uncharacterized protein Z520_02466 [Fonsecaea multimorphosa CBS 102226]|uniref:DUF1223-domain-containing protein n=1 Tax=Fonsecaea multimorphosa CBS 102226 TaxID=1442371 RepID=A0A0D2K8C2_9EURO|nr:uncharacterized protein Z520_02466 [Fonsecaea multimorphosa CBS 102226]KIY02328.1 hypothetical protein Z520_02466 [Fonsecaea multimorphosa CBS 102226]OAL28972.1 hypothetical protein AYO22_02408 [Fonsecaea multimorphosa]
MTSTLSREVKSLFKSFRSAPPEGSHRPDAVLKHAEITGNTSGTSSAAPSPTLSTTSFEQPILIELFQSQGCNSCPPTNDNLISFVQSHQSSNQDASPPRFYASRSPSSSPTALPNSSPEPEYLLLTYQVTYWNYLGWEDTFSLPINDIRQREYVRRMGMRGAYTPMVVVNGRGVGVGNTKEDLERIVRAGRKPAGETEKVGIKRILAEQKDGELGVEIDATSLPPPYSASLAQNLEVWEITYTPSSQDVHIPRGENAGRTLPHLNVVKDVRKIGSLERGTKQRFQVQWQSNERRASLGPGKVVIVQDGKGGGICGVLKL